MLVVFSFITLFLSTVLLADDEFVRVLTEDNFDEVVAGSKRILVEFYAPWCGHCKALQPEYEKAAKRLHEENAVTLLAKVDATEYQPLARKYSVSGYPTLKYFVDGALDSPQEYNGGRTEDTIVSWVLKRELPAVTKLEHDAVDAFKKKNKATLIAFLPGDVDSNPAVKALYNVAESMRESIIVGLVQSDAGKITLFRQFDDPEVHFEGEITAERLEQFIQKEKFEVFGQITGENYQEYAERGLPFVWVAVEGSDAEHREPVENAIKPTAKKFKGELSFVWIDNTKYGQHVTNLGIKSIPGLLITGERNAKYLYQGDVTNSKDIEEWFAKFAKGEIPKFMKSQEPPEENNDSVFVLVGKTFEDVVGNNKNVFVEFYAPWCGHCKKLAPEYDKVGDAFKDSQNLVIAKIDATENDTPEEIRGFPTLIFYPKGSKKGVKYEGGRTSAEMIKWLEKQAKTESVGSKTEL